MGFSSQSGQLGIGIQSVKGTPIAATLFSRLRSGSLGGERSLLIPDPEIGGNRDVPQAYLGPIGYGGDLEFYPRMQMVAQLMYAVMGSKASATVADIEQHTITPAATLPWLTVEERIGANFESMRYTDCKVNSLRLEAEASGYLMGSASLVGLTGESGFSEQGSPTYDETPLMVGGQIDVTFGGTSLNARSFNFEINNNIETDDFRLGSLGMFDAVAKRRELSVGISYRPEDSTLWKAAMWGDTGLSAPSAGPAYEGPVVITGSSFEFAGGTTPYSITINIPNAVVAPFEVTPSGDDIIGNDIEITPIRPSSGTPIATVTIDNDLAAIT